jgi:hypothetical protein
MKMFLKLMGIAAVGLVLFVLWQTVPRSAFTRQAPAQAQALPAPKPCVDVQSHALLLGDDYNGTEYPTGEAYPEVIVKNNCTYRIDVVSHIRISSKENGVELRTGTINVKGLLPGKVGRVYLNYVKFNPHDDDYVITSAESTVAQ